MLLQVTNSICTLASHTQNWLGVKRPPQSCAATEPVAIIRYCQMKFSIRPKIIDCKSLTNNYLTVRLTNDTQCQRTLTPMGYRHGEQVEPPTTVGLPHPQNLPSQHEN